MATEEDIQQLLNSVYDPVNQALRMSPQPGTYQPSVSVGSTPPASPSAGSQWLLTAGGTSLLRTYDGALWTPNAYDALVLAAKPTGYWPLSEARATAPAVDYTGNWDTEMAVVGSCPSVTGLVTGDGATARNLSAASDYFIGSLVAPTTPAVPASTTPQTNTNTFPVQVTITGGTVSAVAINGNTVTGTSGAFQVPSGGTITITYTVAPTWTWANMLAVNMAQPGGGGVMTAECIVQYATTQLFGTVCVMSRWNTDGFILGMDNADHVQVITKDGGGSTTTISAKTLTHNAPHHLAFAYDGSSQKLYIDGALDANFPATGHIPGTTTTGLCFGTQAGNLGVSSSAYIGYLQKAAFYQYEVQPAVILAHYNAMRGN